MSKRWRSHRCLLRRGAHHAPKLQRAWEESGEAAFTCRTILCCAKADLLFYEQRAIDQCRAAQDGYNQSPFARTTRRGIPHSAAVRAKMRLGCRRRGPEWRAKIAASHRGLRHPPEILAKQVATRQSRGGYGKGKPISAEHRARISASVRRTFQLHPELREKQSAAQRGHAVSAETRAKISAAKRRKVVA